MSYKNNYNLIMIEPIKSNYIYKTDNTQKAAKIALEYLNKKYKINQSIIILKDIDTLDQHSFLAKFNDIQKGGSVDIEPPDNKFYNDIIAISKQMKDSLDQLQESVKNKENFEEENNIISIAKKGSNKLDDIYEQLFLLNHKIDLAMGNAGKILKKKKKEEPIEEKEEPIEEKEDTNKINDLINPEIANNLLEPSLGADGDENLCSIQ